MKIKNIAAICKKNKYAVIYERYGESGGVIQYIGDGAAAYPVTGLPALDKESLLTIFDVPEKQREDWFVQVAGIPSEISFAVIMPYDVISQQFVDNLKRLTEQCVLSLDLREREKELARAAEPEQYSLNVDPATGEIVEEESEVADNA